MQPRSKQQASPSQFLRVPPGAYQSDTGAKSSRLLTVAQLCACRPQQKAASGKPLAALLFPLAGLFFEPVEDHGRNTHPTDHEAKDDQHLNVERHGVCSGVGGGGCQVKGTAPGRGR